MRSLFKIHFNSSKDEVVIGCHGNVSLIGMDINHRYLKSSDAPWIEADVTRSHLKRRE